MGMVEVFREPERRRRWSVEEKLSIVAEAALPGATVSGTARCHGLHPNQVFRWRRLAREGKLGPVAEVPGFVPVAVFDEGAMREVSPSGPATGLVEVLLGNGRVVRAEAGIEPGRLSRLVAALERS